MSIIRILPPSEAQKIAAGEIIERPANIAKELIENSLDAGATALSLTAYDGGKKSLIIEDDGCGMSPEDARFCFIRHATSKLTSLDDLPHITSFGFRGEALASIAAVSKVTLTTRRAEDELGIEVINEFGTITHTQPVACNVGTRIVIEDIFHTMPARKKFLKQTETEWNAIQQIIYATALLHRSLHIRLFKNEKLSLNAPPVTTLADRITQLWGHHTTSQMLSLSSPEKEEGIHIEGIISQPSFMRYGPYHLYFFINNRLVKNNELQRALLKGYKGVLGPGKYPLGMLHLTLTGTTVDVNIHPRKEEVRFSKPGLITRIIEQAVQKTLESYTTKAITSPSSLTEADPFCSFSLKDLDTANFTPLKTSSAFFTEKNEHHDAPQTVSSFAPKKQPSAEEKKNEIEEKYTTLIQSTSPQMHSTTPPVPVIQKTLTAPSQPSTFAVHVLGQLHKTYILIQTEEGLSIIDQHAAHERILYNRYAAQFEKKDAITLLFPHVVSLAPSHIHSLLSHRTLFAEHGILFDQAGPEEVAITATPAYLKRTLLNEVMHYAAEWIEEHETLPTDQLRTLLHEHVHSHLACKAAVRAGDVLDKVMMESLVHDLLTTENRFICVHGRPTIKKITIVELEKYFRRC